MIERYKDIKGFEGIYQISNYGNVISLKRGTPKALSLQTDQKGYLSVKLYNGSNYKRYKIHRLVAESFIPNPNNYPQINHINENKSDNRVENLEWCDNKYNSIYSNGKRVIKCDSQGNVLAIYNSRSEAAAENGVSVNTITYRCKKGIEWRYEDS